MPLSWRFSLLQLPRGYYNYFCICIISYFRLEVFSEYAWHLNHCCIFLILEPNVNLEHIRIFMCIKLMNCWTNENTHNKQKKFWAGHGDEDRQRGRGGIWNARKESLLHGKGINQEACLGWGGVGAPWWNKALWLDHAGVHKSLWCLQEKAP